MVRECRPPAREPTRSWLARRSTMATSTPANANSPANISPVGPPPAITTACSVIVPPTSVGSCFQRTMMGHDAVLAASPPPLDILKVAGSGILLSLPRFVVDGQSPREAAAQHNQSNRISRIGLACRSSARNLPDHPCQFASLEIGGNLRLAAFPASSRVTPYIG